MVQINEMFGSHKSLLKSFSGRGRTILPLFISIIVIIGMFCFSDGSLEACLIYRQNKTVINLGTAVGGPSLTDKVLTLQFTGKE